jgi:hypothetical protein
VSALEATGQKAGKLTARSPLPIQCATQEAALESTELSRGRVDRKSSKPQKKRKLIIGEKKRDPQTPRTVAPQEKLEPGREAGERSRQSLDPFSVSVAGDGSRMAVGQPSWRSFSPYRGRTPEHSAGETPTDASRAEVRVSSAFRIHGNVIELAGRVQKSPTRVLLDSGSTGNFVSSQFVAAVGLRVQPDPEWEEISLADGSKLKTEGRVQFVLRCGGYTGRILARVFPNLHKEMILGIPWLRQTNPRIDWTNQRVPVVHCGDTCARVSSIGRLRHHLLCWWKECQSMRSRGYYGKPTSSMLLTFWRNTCAGIQ